MSARTRFAGPRSIASLVLALGATIGYFSLLKVPAVRNRPGLVLAVLGASVLLALAALAARRSLLPVVALAVSALLFSGNAAFHLWWSRVPPSALKVAVGQPAPDFTLPDAAGRPVRLSSFRGQKAVVLVFYRGYW